MKHDRSVCEAHQRDIIMKSLFTHAWRFAVLTPIAFLGHAAVAQDDSSAHQAASESEQPAFLRSTESDKGLVTLEIASRELVRPQGSSAGTGPTVWLVGVAHVAEPSLYAELQKFLGEFDVVLFESVMPTGADNLATVAPEARAKATRQAMELLGSIIERCRKDAGGYPESLDAMRESIAAVDSRLITILPAKAIDAWGRELAYSIADDRSAFTLLSLGADGKPGGAGDDADIVVTDRDGLKPMAVSSDGGLQSELAGLLGMDFQLTAMSYAEPNFRASDMTMDELADALEVRSLDASDLQGALDASSFPAQAMKVLARFIKLADSWTGGAISDVCTLALIEVLGNEKFTQDAMEQFGEGFGDVIIGERNQVVMDDLKHLIENEPGVRSVAIFYGAAHMPDFVERLRDQLGYELSGEEKWFTAMSVDMSQSALPRDQLEMTRGTLRKMLSQQMGALKQRK